jgi:hypothetical protein
VQDSAVTRTSRREVQGAAEVGAKKPLIRETRMFKIERSPQKNTKFIITIIARIAVPSAPTLKRSLNEITTYGNGRKFSGVHNCNALRPNLAVTFAPISSDYGDHVTANSKAGRIDRPCCSASAIGRGRRFCCAQYRPRG